MHVYDLKDREGRVVAFEIDNFLLSRAGVSAVAGSIPGAVVTRAPRRFARHEDDVFCEFEIDGHAFEASEPFGDNSRYLIGPTSTVWCPQVAVVRDAFARHTPIASTLWRLFGRRAS